MKVELPENVVDVIGPFTVLVYPVEGIACSLDRQCWHVDSLAICGNGGNPRSDTKADVVEPTQLLHNGIDLLGVRPLRIKDGLRIIQDYEDLLR